MKKMLIKIWAAILVIIIVISVGFYAAAYTLTPQNIKNPQHDHYHFRLQILLNGEAVDFSKDNFQKEYTPDLCTDNLTEDPIHFHDNRDQFVHIHWEGVTGGQLLKFYGWNEIGGIPGTLGFALSDLRNINNVGIHGNLLPQRPEGINYYVYTGDENGYIEKSWQDFIEQDLEVFFGKSYDDQGKNTSFLDFIIRPAIAHGHEESTHEAELEKTSEELEQINTLVGNVVIFAQTGRPTDEQIKARFNNLVPLAESVCAG